MAEDKSGIDVKRETAASPAPTSDNGWAPMMTLRNEIDRLFEDFSSGHLPRPLSQGLQDLWGRAGGLAVSPATELVECDGEYRITAKLPGKGSDDVEIKLSDGAARNPRRRKRRRRITCSANADTASSNAALPCPPESTSRRFRRVLSTAY